MTQYIPSTKTVSTPLTLMVTRSGMRICLFSLIIFIGARSLRNMSLPSIDRNEDPISWWKTNTTIFPNIKPCVLRFLSAPPSQFWKKPGSLGATLPGKILLRGQFFLFCGQIAPKSFFPDNFSILAAKNYIHTDKFYTFEV